MFIAIHESQYLRSIRSEMFPLSPINGLRFNLSYSYTINIWSLWD